MTAILESVFETLSPEEAKRFVPGRGHRIVNERRVVDSITAKDVVYRVEVVIRPIDFGRRTALARFQIPLKHNLVILVARWKVEDGVSRPFTDWAFFDSALGRREALKRALSAAGRAP